MILRKKAHSIFVFIIFFQPALIFGAKTIEVKAEIDPLKDSQSYDAYIQEGKEALNNIETKINEEYKEAQIEEKNKQLKLLEENRDKLTRWIGEYENAYSQYNEYVKNIDTALNEKEKISYQADLDKWKSGFLEKDEIEKQIKQLEKDIDAGLKLARTNGASSEQPAGEGKKNGEAVEEEDPIIASLIDGIIEHFQITLLAQWWSQLYLSIPEIGWQLFSLIFGEPSIDWSPLEYTPPPDVQGSTQPAALSSEISLSLLLPLFLKLQAYKTGFFEEAKTTSGQEIKDYGDQLNKVLYKIEARSDDAVDYLRRLPNTNQMHTLIATIVDSIQKQPGFSWLMISAIKDPITVNGVSDKTMKASDFIKALKTMQRLEAGFLSWIMDVLKTKRTVSQQEQEGIIKLASAINRLQLKIQKQDPSVFTDLENIETVMVDQMQLLPTELDQDQDFSTTLKNITSRLSEYSQQPTKV